MTNITIEEPPSSLDSNQMSEWLIHFQTQLQAALESTSILQPQGFLPLNPINGMMVYFRDIIPNSDITAPGFWGYEEGAWIKLGA